jgi:hypothetical protein
MRQPTFSRSHARQQRLIRTGLGIVVLVAVVAIIVSLLGGDDTQAPPPDTPQVAFRTDARGFSDRGSLKHARRVPKARVSGEEERITTLLDDLYQRAFVDPSLFAGEPTAPFPFDEIAGHFASDAQDSLQTDADSLTLGTERTQYARVEPDKARAKIAVYFQAGSRPTLAVAEVTFTAVGTLKDAAAQPVLIEQHAVYHLERTGKGWIVAYYEADEKQTSEEPPATTSPSAS